MTCAKKIVECWIVMPSGGYFYGRNDCNTPQASCPRAPGEDYAKCISICNQPGHAEEMAIKAAGDHDLTGATAYMTGTNHFCENCQNKLFEAGVKYLTRGKPAGVEHYIFNNK